MRTRQQIKRLSATIAACDKRQSEIHQLRAALGKEEAALVDERERARQQLKRLERKEQAA